MKPVIFPSRYVTHNVCLLMLALCISGCIPKGPRLTDTLALHTANEPAPVFDDDTSNGSLIQIFAGYRSFIGHAAIRLVAPDDRQIFWDPGSHYGSGDDAIDRKRDVIVGQGVPSVITYMNFRFEELPGLETRFVVLEYIIDDELAETMYGVLLDNHQATSDSGLPFKTDQVTFFCAVSVCEFLQKYAPDDLAPSAVHAYPHDMVQDLLKHHPPHRFIVFHPDRTADIHVPKDRQPAHDEP